LYCNREAFPKRSNFEKATYTYKAESGFLPSFPNLFSNFIRIMRKNHIFALKKILYTINGKSPSAQSGAKWQDKLYVISYGCLSKFTKNNTFNLYENMIE
jgi:hypothetical protein